MNQAASARRVWWSTWPGALALGLVSLMMVALTAAGLFLVALLPPPDGSGTDVEVASGPSAVRRLAWIVIGVACLALPAAVVVLARRAWLGWTLVVLALSALVLAAGLWTLGIL